MIHDLRNFLIRFGSRIATLTGLTATTQSKPVKWALGTTWLPLSATIVVMAIGVVIPSSNFERAKNLGDHAKLAEAAASNYDYRLAEKEYGLVKGKILGVRDIVYPVESIMEKIDDLERKIEKYPGYRDLLLRQTVNYWKLGEIATAKDYFEKAFILDPNGEEVKKVNKLF